MGVERFQGQRKCLVDFKNIYFKLIGSLAYLSSVLKTSSGIRHATSRKSVDKARGSSDVMLTGFQHHLEATPPAYGRYCLNTTLSRNHSEP